jgi:ATP/maltotriose-dependent transcriptional regulator MalT
LIAGGRSNAEIATELFISDTVKTHVTHIFQKLNPRAAMGAWHA